MLSTIYRIPLYHDSLYDRFRCNYISRHIRISLIAYSKLSFRPCVSIGINLVRLKTTELSC
jgi:hypothetical protein